METAFPVKLFTLAIVLPLARVVPYICRSTIPGSVTLYVATAVCVLLRAGNPYSWSDFVAVACFAVLWPAIEAGYHKHLMHGGGTNLSAVNHRRHHANPTTHNGLMPLFPVLLLVSGYWLLESRPIASTLIVTAMVFLCWYETTHTLIHLGWAPRYWSENHARHHRDHRVNLNVTVPRFTFRKVSANDLLD